MKKQLLTLSIACAASVFAMAQVERPSANISTPAEGCLITLDGLDTDPIWVAAEAHSIDSVFVGEDAVTVTSATWKAVWTADTIYAVVKVTEDEPMWSSFFSGLAGWQSDLIELYFDVNIGKIDDNRGASVGLGNIQVAPDYDSLPLGVVRIGNDRLSNSSYVNTEEGGVIRIMEYAVPTITLTDSDEVALAPEVGLIIGFDVCVVDLDEAMETARQRRVWSNNGVATSYTDGKATAGGESWNLMDGVGEITFTSTEATCPDVIATKTFTVDQTAVYPTVVSTTLNINVEGTVEIYNSLGQRVMVSNESSINVSSLNNGVYFAKINNTTARFIVKK
jgi:hypothetical protein